MKREEFLKKWSAVVYEPDPTCGRRYAMADDVDTLLALERGRWIRLLGRAQCTCHGSAGSHYRPCPHYFRDLMLSNAVPGEVRESRER